MLYSYVYDKSAKRSHFHVEPPPPPPPLYTIMCYNQHYIYCYHIIRSGIILVILLLYITITI